MTFCPPACDLEHLLDGQLGEPETDRLRKHLGDCPACAARLDHLSEPAGLRAWRGWADVPRLPTDPRFGRLLEALRETPLLCAATGAEGDPADDRTLPPLGPPACAGDLGTLGPYRILAEVGRGGMGVVLKAYDPALARAVAVKVLRPDRADDAARRRFVREARAAAAVRHDHVVSVFAVSDAEAAVPYLVMEYVEGPTLRQRLTAEGRLDPREAARMVLHAADGLAAAHALGLIHRDVKPANILHDRACDRARIVDFGLVRAADRGTGTTRDGTLPGTPEYMSPEHVRAPDQLDARADVYGLGVTLYELLTGDVPFRGAPHMIVQRVLSDEPLPPRRLNDRVPRDLETVCLKAMAKEPGRRYPSAADLRDDLRRFLAGEPVRARPAGAVERGWRWCRRNPRLAATSLALVLALLGGSAGMAWQWSGAVVARDEARREREQARTDFDRARAAVDKYLTEVSEDPELRARNLEPLRRKLLLSARDFYEHFVAEHPDDPLLRAELGRAHGRLGRIDSFLDTPAKGREHYEHKRDIFEQLHREHPDDAGYQSDLADAYLALATAHHFMGQAEAADDAYVRAAALWEELALAHPDDPDYLRFLLATSNNLGRTRQLKNRLPEAEQAYREGRTAYDRWVRDHAPVARHQARLAQLLTNLSMLYSDTERPTLQEQVLHEAVALGEQLVAADPKGDEPNSVLCHAANVLGILHARRQELDQAEAAWKESLAAAEALVRAHPASPEYQDLLASNYNNLGILWDVYRAVPAAALPFFEKALAINERLVRDYPHFRGYWISLRSTHYNTATLLQTRGQAGAALALTNRVLDLWQTTFPPDQVDDDTRNTLAGLHQLRADALGWLGRYDEALQAYDDALPLLAQGQKEALRLGRRIVECRMLVQKGDYGRAVSLARSVADTPPEDAPRLVRAAVVLASGVVAVRKDDRLAAAERERLAEDYAVGAVSLLRRAQATGYFTLPRTQSLLEADEDLACLRSRDDFKRLLVEINGKVKAGRE